MVNNFFYIIILLIDKIEIIKIFNQGKYLIKVNINFIKTLDFIKLYFAIIQ